jgi:hypothetical protein
MRNEHHGNKGLNTSSKPGNICMVVECPKVALYRASNISQRGYCLSHRPLAVKNMHSSRSATQAWMDRQSERGDY